MSTVIRFYITTEYENRLGQKLIFIKIFAFPNISFFGFPNYKGKYCAFLLFTL